jgi:hypothetical protein
MTSFLDWYANLIERIPVPERSGFKGAVLAVTFLFAMVEGSGSADAYCAIHPYSDLCETPRAGAVVGWRMLDRVYLGKGSRPRECMCHIDWRDPNGPGWQPHDSWMGIPCGFAGVAGVEPDKWVPVKDLGGIGPWYFGHALASTGPGPYTYEVRLHCTDDPQYAPKIVEVPVAEASE